MNDSTYETESRPIPKNRYRNVRLVGHDVNADISKEAVEQLAYELAMGCLEHQPRWYGDTLGGSIREDETNQMMEQGAKYLRALLAERDALKAEVMNLREKNDRLFEKADLLCMIQDESFDVRCISLPTPGGDDTGIGWQIISHYMGKPQEHVIGENFDDNLLAALREARDTLKGEHP
jgi:hypothetical protein